MRKIDSLLLNIDVKQFFNDLSDPNVSFKDLNAFVENAKSNSKSEIDYRRRYHVKYGEDHRESHAKASRKWWTKKHANMTPEMIQSEKEERSKKNREYYLRMKAIYAEQPEEYERYRKRRREANKRYSDLHKDEILKKQREYRARKKAENANAALQTAESPAPAQMGEKTAYFPADNAGK